MLVETVNNPITETTIEIKPTRTTTISVVTPSYNQARFLEYCIESVLAQEGDFALDYLIIDGGSTDDSLTLIKKCEELVASGSYKGRCREVRFRWISEKDRGQADALIKGFSMATGEILGWLNSDDTYIPGTLQRILQYFSAHPGTGCVYGSGIYTTEDGIPACEYPAQPFEPSLLPIRNFICQPAAFFTRTAYEKCGGLDPQLRYALDYDLWIRMARTASFHYLPELLATYRLHDESKTIDPAGTVENHGETLATVLRHYHWAPINRVYGYCLARLRHHSSRFPAPLLALAAICWSVITYLSLNKVPRAGDLKLLNLRNFRLLLSGWGGSPSIQRDK